MGPLFNTKKRFMVLNSDDGTLIRFLEKKDYPLKPKYIFLLNNIVIWKGNYSSKRYYGDIKAWF